MAEVDRQFEMRQLLKAYRKGLISDDLFEEQIREVQLGAASPPAAPARSYRLGDRILATERELLVRFLDELRAGEALGGETFALWCATTPDPILRGGLRVAAEREAGHGRILAARLADLGGRPEVSPPASFREAARQRLGARDVPDLDKVRDLTRRLPDPEAALQPVRDVIAQIDEDHETRALLELFLEDETSTLRWLHAMEKSLAEQAATGSAASPAGGDSPSGSGNGAASAPRAG